MASPALHGKELALVETLVNRYTHRADGHILRNDGCGWRLWRRTLTPVTTAKEAVARETRLTETHPARQAYKLALHRVATLGYRSLITEFLADHIEGVGWSERYWEPSLQPSLSQWRELDSLYTAMVAERKARPWPIT